ncbi:hypothetical protein V7S43_010570 [Phytophthora oleae]|uniref:CBM1 domain-containing protein n=1 Tax=Phytophthora oleae TaxID=2107226 RepID=A0ABD3FEV8_9STRA
MVKISFILALATCAFAGTQAVDTGSASGDTGASVATVVSAGSSLRSTSASVDVDVDVPTTVKPTEAPTEKPTESPTREPTVPTKEPTEAPTEPPTEKPTEAPTEEPTEAPTDVPTTAPIVASPTSVTATVASTAAAPTAKPGPTPISGQVTLVPGYRACGGSGFDYTVYMPEETDTSEYTMLTCDAGYRCQQDDSRNVFSCLEWPSRNPVSFYGQCGGTDYDGQAFCTPGAVCKYISASFSQCLPTY